MFAENEVLYIAFDSDPKLRKRIFDVINDQPTYAPLFEDIAVHHMKGFDQKTSSVHATLEQPAKKRKLENGTATNESAHTSPSRQIVMEVRDVSFQLPQRKKFHLSIVQYGQEFEDPQTTFSLCIRSPATNQIEYEYPLSAFDYTLRLLVPEKATKQYNYCFLPPTHSENEAVLLVPGEGVIWTMNDGPLKSYTISSPHLKSVTAEPADVFFKILELLLQKSGKKLVIPTESEFSCTNPEAHRKKEKAYHVKAHRGSKDGYLWFLSTGIFFGFKKPLAFFPFHQIESVSYTAVLQRTFNLVVTVSPDPKGEPQEIEFSMLDQADFGGIDAYIKKHQLQDASMAEARKAKHFKVNGKQNADGEDGVGELEKAEQEAIDEEDEMEEDYDPEEDGDSDGSGTSEDEDEYDNGGGGGNLVEEELGSEAEEVEEDDEAEQEEEEVKKEEPKPQPKRPTTAIVRHPGPSIDDDDQL